VAQQEGKEASGGKNPRVQALEVHQHTLFRHLKNEFVNRNLSQNMSKNSYFVEKKAVKGLRPRTPIALRKLGTPPPDSRIVTLTY